MCATPVPDTVSCNHAHAVGPNQCCFVVTHQISAVWPVVHRFDNPQAYKHFVKSYHVVNGGSSVGTVRDGSVGTLLLLFKWPIQSTDVEEPAAGEDEDTGALVTLIVKLEEVAVTTGEEDEDTILDL